MLMKAGHMQGCSCCKNIRIQQWFVSNGESHCFDKLLPLMPRLYKQPNEHYNWTEWETPTFPLSQYCVTVDYQDSETALCHPNNYQSLQHKTGWHDLDYCTQFRPTLQYIFQKVCASEKDFDNLKITNINTGR